MSQTRMCMSQCATAMSHLHRRSDLHVALSEGLKTRHGLNPSVYGCCKGNGIMRHCSVTWNTVIVRLSTELY